MKHDLPHVDAAAEFGTLATLSIPIIDPEAGVLAAALKYAAANWYLGPIDPADRKNPGSVLGKRWHTKTSRDPETIVGWFAGTSWALFLHAGRSGAWIADVDEPELIHPVLRAAITDAGPPHQESRPDQPGRGHYPFLQPHGRMIGNGIGGLKTTPKWGEGRGLNGVVIVEPSPHADEEHGGEYHWLQTGPVPEMPAELADALPDAGATSDAATDREIKEFIDRHVSSDRHYLIKGPLGKFGRDVADGEARHEALVSAACWLAREARYGYYPARTAFNKLSEAFIDAMATARTSKERVLKPGPALSEAKGAVAWAIGQANGESQKARQERAEKQRERLDEPRTTPSEDGHAPTTTFVLPDEVWSHSFELMRIRQAALSAQVSPDVLLHACLAILAAGLHHGVRLDTGRRPTGLGYYVAAVGPPGAGKSLGLECAGELMESWLAEDRFEVTGNVEDGGPGLALIGPASGEGLIEAFMGSVHRTIPGPDGEPLTTKDGKIRLKEVRVQVRHNGLISTDEAESLFKVGSRQGNTLIPAMRSMWSGSEVATTTADANRNRRLPGKSYVLSALFGFQPGIIDPLFSDENGGLPQRFVFAQAAHPDISGEEVAWPGDLRPDVLPGAFTLTLPPELRTEVRNYAADHGSGREETGRLDGHLMLLRCRIAALLALLHGSKEVADYWTLAETLLATSCVLRDHLAGQQERRNLELAQTREDAAVRTAVRSARETETAVQGDRLRRAADAVVRAVKRAGADGLARGRAKNAAKSWREHADAAIDACLESGRLTSKTEALGGQEVEVLHAT